MPLGITAPQNTLLSAWRPGFLESFSHGTATVGLSTRLSFDASGAILDSIL